jgi:hypothetical protein
MESLMSDARILAERDGTILTLTLNRPDKLNAIDGGMLDAFGEALGEIERDREVRAVILTGAGRAFSAGADIKEWTALTPLEFGRSWGRRGHAVFDRLAALPPPVIAAINGIAFGGGLELALCADMRIASAQARLGLPEVTIAALPGWGGTQRLPRPIGAGRAKHMILTGQPIDAARAEILGPGRRGGRRGCPAAPRQGARGSDRRQRADRGASRQAPDRCGPAGYARGDPGDPGRRALRRDRGRERGPRVVPRAPPAALPRTLTEPWCPVSC